MHLTYRYVALAVPSKQRFTTPRLPSTPMPTASRPPEAGRTNGVFCLGLSSVRARTISVSYTGSVDRSMKMLRLPY
jgi:hypothetical protein